MDKKDIAEIKKRYTPDRQNFTRIAGAYVNSEKAIVSKFREPPLSFSEEEFGRYLDVAKKSLSGRVGNQLICRSISGGEEQAAFVDTLEKLASTGLKDDAALDDLYRFVIANYECAENFLIIAFADTYDVIAKASDGASLDESEDVFQYVLVSICPVKRTKPSLGFVEDEERIGEIFPVWSAAPVDTAFMYPAFTDRCPDNDHMLTYSKQPAKSHRELFVEAMGLEDILSSAEKTEDFRILIDNALPETEDDESGEKRFNIADGLDNYIRKQKELNGNTGDESDEETPITSSDVKDILLGAGVPEDKVKKTVKEYDSLFRDAKNKPAAEDLIDKSCLKLQSLYHEKQALKREVARLNGVSTDSNDGSLNISMPEDVRSTVKKISKDGKEYIAIPVEAGKKMTVNGKPI